LEAEPDSNAHRAGHHVQRRQVDPGGLKYDQQAHGDDEVADDGAGWLADPHLDGASGQQAVNDPPAQPGGHPERQHDEHRQVDQSPQPELGAAQTQQNRAGDRLVYLL
jgi:hypothetical protein